jgi:hypothetical protein
MNDNSFLQTKKSNICFSLSSVKLTFVDQNQLTSQVSQAEHWAFEALREARRSRRAAQATLGVVLIAAAMLIVIISFKL